MTGTFSILNFPASNNGQAVEPPVAYAEAGTGALYLDKPREVQAYDTVWADMTGRALSELESRGFIAQIAEEFSDA